MTWQQIKDSLRVQLWMLLKGRKYSQQYRATADHPHTPYVGEAKPTSTAALTTAVYPIEGLSCGHCVAHATEALKAVAGVSSVTISLEAGEASVTYDAEHCTPEALRSAVEAAGYTLRIDAPKA